MKKRIGRYLAYINRARQYIGIVNSSLLLIIFLNSFDIILRWYWYPVLVIGAVVLFVIIGFIDIKSGIRAMEMLVTEKNSPIRMEMYKMIKEIHKKTKIL